MHKKISVQVEQELATELRKKLFRNNITIQTFLHEMIERFLTHDEYFLQVIDELAEKTEKENVNKKRLKQLDADAIYALIENSDQ